MAVYEPKLLRTLDDVTACRAEIGRVQTLAPDAQSTERVQLLRKLIELYEADALAAQATDALDAIRIRMLQRGLRQRDLALWLGGRNRASEVLAGKRPLTARMIASLSAELNIPVALLSEAAAPRRRRRSNERLQ